MPVMSAFFMREEDPEALLPHRQASAHNPCNLRVTSTKAAATFRTDSCARAPVNFPSASNALSGLRQDALDRNKVAAQMQEQLARERHRPKAANIPGEAETTAAVFPISEFSSARVHQSNAFLSSGVSIELYSGEATSTP